LWFITEQLTFKTKILRNIYNIHLLSISQRHLMKES